MATTFPTSALKRKTSAAPTARPIVSRIVAKFQTTIPAEIRELYGLQEGDIVEWSFDPATSQLVLTPKRAQILTAQVQSEMAKVKAEVAAELRASVAAVATR